MKINYLCAFALATFMLSCANKNANVTKEDSTVEDSIQNETLKCVEFDTFSVKGTVYKMIKVEGGEFNMGASENEKSMADPDEFPEHPVEVKTFYIGEMEVTQKLWQDVMGSNPSEFVGEENPVDRASWNECQVFIDKLNNMTGRSFRLPTEAEWEFAARGGNNSKHYIFAGSDDIEEVAWYDSNRDGKTHKVGEKKPNELGLYDMCGNVAEWCSDWYDAKYYELKEKNNPTGPDKGSYRVLRGGGWYITNKQFSRIANRSGNTLDYKFNYLGLRLAE